jgi:hypothetical protein
VLLVGLLVVVLGAMVFGGSTGSDGFGGFDGSHLGHHGGLDR